MTYVQYSAQQVKAPYTYKIKSSNGNWLYYFGIQHVFASNDPQLGALHTFWNDFVATTDQTSRVALVEGGVPRLFESEEESVSKGSEGGLVAFLANKERISVLSPEPSRKQEMEGFEKEFSKDEVEYYYFARMVHQWGRTEPRPRFENYMNFYLQQDKKSCGWLDFEFTIEKMKEIHQKLFKTTFDENNTEFFYSIINPTSNETAINRYSSFKGVTRDAQIVKEVLAHVAAGENVFVVYGFTHAVMQEPAYKALLK